MKLSLIAGLNTGRGALHAQQSALQVTGNNIANVNTPGYSRQKVSLQTGLPQNHNPIGSISIGVTVEDINRVRDVFMDDIFRRETQNLGCYETLKNYLTQIESIFNEPSETGLSSLMSRFFNAFQDLANNPEDLSTRMVLRERGASLTNAINETHFKLSQMQRDIGETLKGKINEVNNIAQQIAKLNQQIKNTEAAQKITNELRDRRDLLVDQLSKLVDIDVLNKEDGTLTINAGQKNLVSDMFAHELEINIPKIGSVRFRSRTPGAGLSGAQASVKLAKSNSPLSIRSGELRGLLDVHNDIIPHYQKRLDDLAAELAKEVNEWHQKGFGLDNSTGNSFFTFTSVSPSDNIGAASTIAINDVIFSDVKKIAASGESDAPSDNSIAIMISQLRTNKVMNEDTATFSDFYQSIIAELGGQSKNANQFREAQKLVVSQINQRRESVSGVSLDEEAIDLINYQSAYQAAARYINTVNELLDVVVNRL
ncbi:TPA: flagellar hook-associated protein FlgK [Candidatus Poribacteria bacterium]|nr:flagellar hook-associated protein FlgK [Candidatus Poribacteria bacterium]